MSVLPGSVNEEDRDDALDAALETVLNVVSSLRLEHNQRQWCRNGLHSDRFIYRISISCYLYVKFRASEPSCGACVL